MFKHIIHKPKQTLSIEEQACRGREIQDIFIEVMDSIAAASPVSSNGDSKVAEKTKAKADSLRTQCGIELGQLREYLIAENAAHTDDFALVTAKKLKETVDKVLHETLSSTDKPGRQRQIRAIEDFRQFANRSKLSNRTKTILLCVAGTVLALGLTIGILIATAGVPLLATPAVVGAGVAIFASSSVVFATAAKLMQLYFKPKRNVCVDNVCDDMKQWLKASHSPTK